MAVSNFIPTIWSARILQNLQKALVYGNLVNRDYQGEIANQGDTVKIGGIGAVTVGDYTKNSTTITWQVLADASQTLTIDQAKYFAFKVDDVDQAQTNPKLMDEAMREAAYAIGDAIDGFVAALHSQVSSANKIGADGGSAKTIGYGSGELDAYKYLVSMGEVLTENNVPQTGRWVVVPPWYGTMLRINSGFTAAAASPAGQAVIAQGGIGKVGGFDVYESNNVTNDAGSPLTYRIMAGVRETISLAVQKTLTPEALRLQDVFADGVKGLVLYGGRVVRPSALCVLYAKEGALS